MTLDDTDGRSPVKEPGEQTKVIRGRQVTPDNDFWFKAGEEVTPLKSLERIDGKAGFVLGNVTLIGTVLAGLGLLGSTTGRLADHLGWVQAVVWLVLLSVVCALAANLPSARTRLNTANGEAVRRFFTRNIMVRGWLTRIALLLFCAAFAIVVGVLLQIMGGRPEPSLVLQWTTGDGGERALVARVAASGLPPGARAETRLLAEDGIQDDVVLATNVSVTGDPGVVEVSIEVAKVPQTSTIRLAFVVTDQGKKVAGSETHLNP